MIIRDWLTGTEKSWPVSRGSLTEMYGTWEPGEGGPEGFYRKLGFQLTGEESGGQAVGMLDLTSFS